MASSTWSKSISRHDPANRICLPALGIHDRAFVPGTAHLSARIGGHHLEVEALPLASKVTGSGCDHGARRGAEFWSNDILAVARQPLRTGRFSSGRGGIPPPLWTRSGRAALEARTASIRTISDPNFVSWLSTPGRATVIPPPDMKSAFPTAQEYSSERARYPAMTVVDLRAEQAAVTESYKNQVLLNINQECLRLAVFEGEYRWHQHPDSDELFLVATGKLQIEFEDGMQTTLAEWQSLVVPAGTVHRTRAIGRTVNVTFEKQGAQTVFVDAPSGHSAETDPLLEPA